MAERRDKINYYLDIAEQVAERSTCLRRAYGVVIVAHDEIVSTGYNGAPRGRQNCTDRNYCIRELLAIPHGERYELCRSVHAEANAMISASRERMLESTLYLVGKEVGDGKSYVSQGEPCDMCKRLIINAGIAQVIVRDSATAFHVLSVIDLIKENR